ncbi:hypothetical protein NXF25_018859 [Crotalus adamanteus]|uniref:Uncharacterized protein n=1 Tax=Crotalus adamanteus TaxID=8729 RepID=A0AAW1B0H8_CROAD
MQNKMLQKQTSPYGVRGQNQI